MKKLFLLLALFLSVSAFAEDVIITKNSERINAIILEVNLDVIKYKKSDSPDGPTYTMVKDDIASVLYSNGQVDVFSVDDNNKTQTNQVTNQTQTNFQQSTSSYKTISRMNGEYYEDGKAISRDQYLSLAKKNCPMAYSQYKKGTSILNGGIAMLTIGAPSLAMGIIVFSGIVPIIPVGITMITGSALMAFGSTCICIGVPLCCVGPYKRKKSVETYNNGANQRDLSLNLVTSSTGIGLSLNF